MFLLLLVSACWCASALAGSAQYYDPEEAALHFTDFIERYGREYTNEQEKEARFQIFKANLEQANRLNDRNSHAVFGITEFMDLTTDEFKQMFGLKLELSDAIFCDTILTDKDIDDASAPEAFDWRQKNAVTKVKDQGSCGSCWAFSVTGHLESQIAIKHNKLINLSEQQIIDCDKTSHGCDGGIPSNAFRALMSLGGGMAGDDYPYEARTGECRSDKSKAVVNVTTCYSYNLTSQEKVKQLMYKTGPIVIGIRAQGLQMLSNGIIDDITCSSGPLNHAVLLVGYGTENDIPYWIVKNSWGPRWSGDGYFRMQRNGGTDGACGMLNTYMTSADIA